MYSSQIKSQITLFFFHTHKIIALKSRNIFLATEPIYLKHLQTGTNY